MGKQESLNGYVFKRPGMQKKQGSLKSCRTGEKHGEGKNEWKEGFLIEKIRKTELE